MNLSSDYFFFIELEVEGVYFLFEGFIELRL